MSLIYHLHYYGGYQCTLQVQNTFCYFRWNINIILIWLYNSHLFKCAMRYRSDSQWAGGICFRASCRASKRSSGSVSSDTNKQTTRSKTLICLDTSAVWLSNRSAGSKTSGYYMSCFIFCLLHLRSVVFFNPIPKFGTILKFKTLMSLRSKKKH